MNSEFIKNVEELKCTIDYQGIFQLYEGNENKDKYKEQNDVMVVNEITENSMLLFENNNIKYYGNRNIVYNKIFVLNDLQDYDMKETIVLSADVPEYIMHIYLKSCHDGKFDINSINTNDFHKFLNFIDKYPTRDLSIDLLEMSLIKYMEKNNIPFNDVIKKFCRKYHLKYMILYEITRLE
jgi:hypothetical protein